MNYKEYGIGEREIKFRAWDGKYMRFDEDFNIHSIKKSKDFDDEDNSIWVVMQYTGLKDKNGKEIYEGDVIKSDSEKGVVCYKECYFYMQYPNSRNFITTERIDLFNYEVIGNVFENPELISNK